MNKPSALFFSWTFSILLILLFCNQIAAQKYIVNVKHLSVEQGLNSRTAYWIHQDHKGFIWVSTNQGLTRYDATHFKKYSKEKYGFRTNDIRVITEDKNQKLWLLHSTEIEVRNDSSHYSWFVEIFDPHTEEITTLEEDFASPIPLEELYYLKSDSEKNIYFSTYQGAIYRYDGADFSLLYQSKKKSPIVEFAILSTQEIAVIQDTTLTLLQLPNTIKKQIPLSDYVHYLSVDAHHQLWVEETASEGTHLFYLNEDLNLESFQEDSTIFNPNFINTNAVFFDKDSLIWTQLYDQWLIYDQNGDYISDISEQLNPYNFSPVYIFFDKNNDAWICSRDGVYLVSIQRNPFTTVFSPKEGLVDCRGIIEDKNGTLYLVASEVLKKEANNHKVTKIDLLGSVGAMCDTDGNLWFGNYSNVISRYHPTTEEKKFYSIYTDGEREAFIVTTLYQTKKDGKIWIGTQGKGLAYMKGDSAVWFNPSQDGETCDKLTISDFFENQDGLWLGTDNGLYLLNLNTQQVTAFDLNHGGVPNFDIRHIHQDKAGVFWLATFEEGLIKWDKEAGDYQQFLEKDGLSSNVIYAVYEDQFQQLWLPSNRGLMQFNKENNQVYTFYPEDGLLHEEFNTYSHYQAADGQLFFGGLKGVISFYPEELKKRHQPKHPARLEVLKVEQFDGNTGELIDVTQTFQTDNEIMISPSIKSFSLEFGLLDFRANQHGKFAYRIKGWQEQWSFFLGNNLRINGLPYGDYTLEIRAHNDKGQAAATILKIPLSVIKPFYLSTWFAGLLFFLFLFAFYLFYQWRTAVYKKTQVDLERMVAQRTAKIEQQTEELRQLDQLKSRFFANVSHELRTPLTLILAPTKSMLKGNRLSHQDFTFAKLIQQNAEQLLRLVNEILDLNKLEKGKLELQENVAVFYPFLQRVIANFESQAQMLDIQLHFNYEADQYLQLNVDEQKLTIILNNLLSNALKFTPSAGQVMVEVKDLAHSMQIMVKDTGKGIHPDDLPLVFNRFYQSKQKDAATQGGTGIGLALSQEYAHLMNGSLKVESEWGKGATFVLIFPKKEVVGSPILENKPIVKSNSWQKTATASAEKSTISNPKTTILVVEDNLNLAEYLQIILEAKYNLLKARNGQEALDVLEAAPRLPQLILSDIMMPIMDGFLFLEKLKATEKWQRIPVIMLTARIQLKDKLKALRIGVDDYLYKPFEEAELLVRIENLLKHATARQAIAISPPPPSSSLAQKATNFKPDLSPTDLIWLEEVENIVVKEMGSFTFTVEELSHQLALSSRQLQRKLKENTGLSPLKYIQEVRLNKARECLETGEYSSVKSAAYAIAMKDVRHFSKLFKKRFGRLPSSYIS